MINEVEEPHSDTEPEQLNHKKVKLNEIRGGSKVRSWIWKYFEPHFKEGVGTSTSNCFEHLANIYGIIKEQEEANINSNQNQDIVKAFSKKIHHQESCQLELCQYLADWII
ncbi:9951_t:CDS:2, partial [Funneliformis geosporum]